MKVYVVFRQDFYYEYEIERAIESDVSQFYLFKLKRQAKELFENTIRNLKYIYENNIIKSEQTRKTFTIKYNIKEKTYKSIIKIQEKDIL